MLDYKLMNFNVINAFFTYININHETNRSLLHIKCTFHFPKRKLYEIFLIYRMFGYTKLTT